MIRYLTLDEVLDLHRRLIDTSGGSHGVRNLGAVDSALAQPQMTFGGQELYPDLANKAAALGFSLIMNHAYIDGNKRIGHAAMEAFLVLNDHELTADIDEQERIILAVAPGEMTREEFTNWVRVHVRGRGGQS